MKRYHILAILVSAIVSFALQFLWFTMLFAEPYLEGLGKTQAEMDSGATAMEAFAIQLISNIVLAFVVSWLMVKMNYLTVSHGIQLAVLIWLGFIVAVIGPMFAFQAYSMNFFLINAFGYLLPVLVSAIIFGLWKK